jgi:hypothetical protein
MGASILSPSGYAHILTKGWWFAVVGWKIGIYNETLRYLTVAKSLPPQPGRLAEFLQSPKRDFVTSAES